MFLLLRRLDAASSISKVQFPIFETFSSRRTEPYVGDEFSYYKLEHHFKSITKYKVLAGSESGEIYLFTTDSADLPDDAEEREVVSVFSGVWCDLKSFAESLLVTYYDHWKSFVRVRPCKECGELRMPPRVHRIRDGFCDEQCKNKCHLNNRYSNCRRRHNEAMQRHESKSTQKLKPYFLTFDDCAAANCSDEKKERKGFHCILAAEKNYDYLCSIIEADKNFALKDDMLKLVEKGRR